MRTTHTSPRRTALVWLTGLAVLAAGVILAGDPLHRSTMWTDIGWLTAAAGAIVMLTGIGLLAEVAFANQLRRQTLERDGFSYTET